MAEKHWYVIKAIGGKEKKVKEYIDAEIRKSGLEDLISQVLIPTEKIYQISVFHEEGFIGNRFNNAGNIRLVLDNVVHASVVASHQSHNTNDQQNQCYQLFHINHCLFNSTTTSSGGLLIRNGMILFPTPLLTIIVVFSLSNRPASYFGKSP